EIYDPKKDAWKAGPPLSAPRSNHATVQLADGLVAIIGGGASNDMGLPSGDGVLASVDLFDPSADAMSAGPALATGRGFHQAVRLADGRVLVVGGVATGGSAVLDAEALDAAHTAFSPAGTLATGHAAFGLARLTTGDVVAVGGIDGGAITSAADRFDASANTWSPLPSMSTGRLFVAVAPLANGGLLAAAGISGTGTFSTSTETLASGAAAWSPGPDLPGSSEDAVGGSGLALLRLESGTVLGAGAYAGSPITQSYGPGSFSGVFDEATRKWTKTSRLDAPRGIPAIVELADHRVMLLGGIGANNGATATCSVTAAPVD
ncbi:MAG TPA: kelch repeat-containing protein, partial [Minicystis sp.]|nr:kelch repeat-containing protein [Minicystis sp.]